MKGLEWKMLVEVIVLVVIVGIVVAVVVFPLLAKGEGTIPKTELRGQITKLCPEWVAVGCDFYKADTDAVLSVVIEGSSTQLSSLCAGYFGSTGWDDSTYKKCKEICIGCPS